MLCISMCVVRWCGLPEARTPVTGDVTIGSQEFPLLVINRRLSPELTISLLSCLSYLQGLKSS